MDESKPAAKRFGIGFKLAGRVYMLGGGAAVALALGLLALIVGGAVWFAMAKPAAFKATVTSPLWISFALWIVMMAYWSAAARQSAPAKRAESQASRSRHQLLLNLALLLAFLPIPFLRRRWLPDSVWTVVVGLAVQLGAMGLDVWAMRCLGRNWSGAVTIKVDHQLVKRGPYRLVRHPIYTAMIGMYVGTSIVSAELHGLAGVVVAALAYWRKTRMEERGLIEAFGQAYVDYSRESWALIPWVL